MFVLEALHGKQSKKDNITSEGGRMKINKLKPVTGLAMLGLVGYVNATCYYETSYVCREAGDEVAEALNGDCYNIIKAKYDWTNYLATTNPGGTPHSGLKPSPCQGPAIEHNCVDGQDYDVGTYQYNDGQLDMRVDPLSPSC
jgi:hypothetical protein